MAWGARVALRRPTRNRLKIGLLKEGTVSDDIFEARRLTRTDGGDTASIYLGARRGVPVRSLQARLCVTSDESMRAWRLA